MTLILRILAVGAAVAVVWLVFRMRYTFVVRVRGGRARCTHGKVPPAFLSEISDVCRDAGVLHGRLTGVQRDRRVALTFSRHFPPEVQQRLRNTWTALPPPQTILRRRQG